MHRVCSHAKFITSGGTEGIGCVPLHNVLLFGVCPCKIYCFWLNRRHWVYAHAKFIYFGGIEGIGCVRMKNSLFLT